MATKIKPGQKITADGAYYLQVSSDTWYNLEATYASGTGTITIARARGDYTTDVQQNYKLPDGSTTLTFTKTGISQALVKSGSVDPWILLTVSSASSLSVIIDCRKTDV
jgi:hypothetical protein